MAHKINLARTPAHLQAPAYEMYETIKALRAMVAEAVDASPACVPSVLAMERETLHTERFSLANCQAEWVRQIIAEEDTDDASFERLSLADLIQEEEDSEADRAAGFLSWVSVNS